MKMRGSADKVDQTRDGALLVCDIKTGGNRTFVEIADNPVVRGTKLQLPVYAYAARARHGGENVEAFYWFVRRDRGRISIQLGESLDTTYRETIATLVAPSPPAISRRRLPMNRLRLGAVRILQPRPPWPR